jgi:hypothetical protein
MINPSTQSFTDIEDISHDLVILRGGSACLILSISAINFGLFSDQEQDATIYAYSQLLNSLTYSIQILVSSKRKDISDYIKRLDSYLVKTREPKLRDQIGKYREFVSAIVRQGNILDKKFYIVIPFSTVEAGLGSALANLLNPRGSSLPKEELINRAVNNLSPKRDHLIRLLARIGLKARQLTSQELLQLFFDFYNPDLLGTKVELPKSSQAETAPTPMDTPAVPVASITEQLSESRI